MYKTPAVRSYDTTQIEAKLKVCRRCKRAFYFTHPRTVCIECRAKAAKARHDERSRGFSA